MRSIELFSGAGGLALGLEAAGFNSVALIEKNRDACATLRLNRPDWNILETDVRKVDFTQFESIDFVAGGPPCQPFSIGGKANGYDDVRDMFPHAVRAVRELKPKAFMFENVRGLLRPMFNNYVEYIRLQLTYPDFPISANIPWEVNFQRLQKQHTSIARKNQLTYQVSIHLADAADYGVPQRRHRVFFVGFRADLDSNWFFPTPTHSEEELVRSKFISKEYWGRHNIRAPISTPPRLASKLRKLVDTPLFSSGHSWRTVRDALVGLPDPHGPNTIPNHVYQMGAKAYPGHTGSPLDEPAKALKAGDHGVPGGENMMSYPNGKVRYFTVRESARIQTFPDNFLFRGSWTESMRQLGNAVPVKLAHVVAASIHKHLKNFQWKASSSLIL